MRRRTSPLEPPTYRNTLVKSPAIHTRRLHVSFSSAAILTTALCLTIITSTARRSVASGGLRGSGPGMINHPAGVIPSNTITIPPGWPLDDNGAITCLTCHIAVPSAGSASTPNLRDGQHVPGESTEFCAKCHGQARQGGLKSVHWLALGMAHVSTGRGDRSNAGDKTLDYHSRQCLSCHDGVNAPESRNETPWTSSHSFTGLDRRDHPIGINYNDLSRPGNLTPLRPAGLLPQEIALPEGKVGCVSCHNLYAGTRYLLTVPIAGSELCLTCHDIR